MIHCGRRDNLDGLLSMYCTLLVDRTQRSKPLVKTAQGDAIGDSGVSLSSVCRLGNVELSGASANDSTHSSARVPSSSIHCLRHPVLRNIERSRAPPLQSLYLATLLLLSSEPLQPRSSAHPFCYLLGWCILHLQRRSEAIILLCGVVT